MDSLPIRNMDDPNVLSATREMFSCHPQYQSDSAENIANVLRNRGFMAYRPHEAAVQAALEVLTIEEELLP